MVLFASSKDGETTPEEPIEFLQNLCKIQRITEAQTNLGIPTQLKGDACRDQEMESGGLVLTRVQGSLVILVVGLMKAEAVHGQSGVIIGLDRVDVTDGISIPG
jgi:hypothetical protein